VEERRFDEAIARLGEPADAEGLVLLGRAWAGKAESAAVPTPAPGGTFAAGAPLKPEEERALAFYARAVAARPDLAAAHLGIARLLAPHALALAGRTAGAGPAEVSVDRVLRSFGDAAQADTAGTEALEGMIGFAMAAGRPADARQGFQELLRRRREDPALLVRYGDFLAGPGGDPEAALGAYAQALIWRPDDGPTRHKSADIHLAAAAALLRQQQYAAAEARLGEARRCRVDATSPQAARLRELEARIGEIRGR
jgi:tetratricopeptide (TPR) repeat protein